MANRTEGTVYAFMAEEWFRSGESIHIHGLIGGARLDDKYRPWWEWWKQHYGISWWRVYNPKLGAGWYVTKYILKQGAQLGDWDFFVERPRKKLDIRTQIEYTQRQGRIFSERGDSDIHPLSCLW